MLALAKYTLKGPYYAAAVVAVLVILSVLIPVVSGNPMLSAMVTTMLTVVAGSLVGLIILTQGVQSGLKAIAASILGITAVAAVVLKAPGLGISIGLVQWLPIVILAHTLRVTNSLPLTLITGVAVGLVVVIGQFWFAPNLADNWISIIEQSVQLPPEQTAANVDFAEQIRVLMHWLVMALVGSMYAVFVAILLLSRWLQAKLAESDGFSREIQSLSLGKPAALVAAVILALSVWLAQSWLISMAILVAAAFLFQGIAVVHVRLLKNRFRAMLTGLFYMLLLIIPQVMALTVIAGVLDNWLFFRKREKTESDH